MYGFVTSEGVEISVTTAHFLGDELSADVELEKNYKLVTAFSRPGKEPL